MDFVSNVHSSSNNSSRPHRLTLKTLKSQKYIYELHAHRINTFYIINKKKVKAKYDTKIFNESWNKVLIMNNDICTISVKRNT